MIGAAEDQHLDQLVKHEPIENARAVAAKRMRGRMIGQQGGELVPRDSMMGWQARGRSSHAKPEDLPV